MSELKTINKILNYSKLDNIDGVNTSLSNYLNLSKGINNGKEPSLLKYIGNEFIDIELKNSTKQIRMIRDTTTDVLTNVLIDKGDAVKVFDFVDFMYNYSFCYLLENINVVLTKNDIETHKNINTYMLPLQYYDNVNMYFKGGTLMKYFKDRLYDKFPDLKNDQISANSGTGFEKNFKVSDTDLSVHIDTKLYYRCTQIKYGVSVILAECLNNISTLLDTLLDYTFDKDATKYESKDFKNDLTKINNLKNIFKTDFYNIQKIKNILSANKPDKAIINPRKCFPDYNKLKNTFYFFKRYSAINDNFNEISNSFTELLKYIIDIPLTTRIEFDGSNLKNVLPNVLENAMLIEIIDYIRFNDFENYNNVKPYLKNTSTNTKYKQENYMIKYRKLLVDTNKYLFYEKFRKIELLFVNYNEFIDKLADGLYDIKKNMINEFNSNPSNVKNQIDIANNINIDNIKNTTPGFDNINKIIDYDKSPNEIFRFNFNLKRDDIKKNILYHNDAKRSDFILKNSKIISNKLQLVEFKDKHVNYIGYNNSLFNLNNRNVLNVAFALIRIKHNVKISDIMYNINNTTKMLSLQIPSEILDISITESYDSMHHIIHNISNDNSYYTLYSERENKNNYIVSINEHIVYNDLNAVLFYQNSFVPWVDKKYAKRIFRMIMFIKILDKNDTKPNNDYKDMFNNLKNIVNNINTENINNSNINNINDIIKEIYGFNVDIDYIKKIYNKTNTFDNLLSTQNKYKYVQFIINFIIINLLFILNINNSDNLNKFINIINNLYNLYNNFSDEFISFNNDNDKFNNYKGKYINFIKDIKKIFEEFDNNNIIKNI